LEIAFRSGDPWHIPVREYQKQEASKFEAAVHSMS